MLPTGRVVACCRALPRHSCYCFKAAAVGFPRYLSKCQVMTLESGGDQLARNVGALPHALDGRIVCNMGEKSHPHQICNLKMTPDLSLGISFVQLVQRLCGCHQKSLAGFYQLGHSFGDIKGWFVRPSLCHSSNFPIPLRIETDPFEVLSEPGPEDGAKPRLAHKSRGCLIQVRSPHFSQRQRSTSSHTSLTRVVHGREKSHEPCDRRIVKVRN